MYTSNSQGLASLAPNEALGRQCFEVAIALAALCCGALVAVHCNRQNRPSPRCPRRSRTAGPARGSLAGSDWYHGFGSAELDGLIARAARSNLDLAAARARLTQADARSRQAGAALLPAVERGGNGNFLAGHSGHGSAHELDWSALLSTSYEVDFWGRNRATANAARFLGAAARADQDTLALTTTGRRGRRLLRAAVAARAAEDRAVESGCRALAARGGAGRASTPARPIRCSSPLNARCWPPPNWRFRNCRQRESEALTALALLVGQPPEAIPGRRFDAGRPRPNPGGTGAAGAAADPAPRHLPGRGQSACGGCRPGRRARRDVADTDPDGRGRCAESRHECGRHGPVRHRARR